VVVDVQVYEPMVHATLGKSISRGLRGVRFRRRKVGSRGIDAQRPGPRLGSYEELTSFPVCRIRLEAVLNELLVDRKDNHSVSDRSQVTNPL